jgi:hypothetical protein
MKRFLLVTFQFLFPFGRQRRLDLLGYFVIFLLLFFPLGGWKLITPEIKATEEDRVYGQLYDVPGFRWAKVMNRYGVETLDVTIHRFENCLIRYRGQVQEIVNHSTWWSSINNQVLVEYSPPENSATTGVLCPDGTIFYIPREELDAFQEEFRQRQEMEAQIIDEVSDVLDNQQAGLSFQVEDFFTWVEVVNPEGVENYGYQLGFLDSCGIEAWGEVQEIGQTRWGALYEYAPDPARGFIGIGVPCPAQTLFFLEGAQPVSRANPTAPSA